MYLYRLDFLNAEGRAIQACRYAGSANDYLTRDATRARADARMFALYQQREVGVTRISGGGRMKLVSIATTDGKFRRPTT